MRHLCNHLGKDFFDPEYKVQMLSDGNMKVTCGSIEYAYEDGGIKETIDFTYKNMADEAAAQLSRQMKSRGITSPGEIVRVDVVHGGDYGKGAFIAGARLSVILSDEATAMDVDGEKEKHESFSFEISVAEILCRKDNAEILTLTIRDELTKGLKTIATNNLNISVDEKNEIVCSFGDATSGQSVNSLQANLYVVGDLVFYDMVLGQEGAMSGDHCHL